MGSCFLLMMGKWENFPGVGAGSQRRVPESDRGAVLDQRRGERRREGRRRPRQGRAADRGGGRFAYLSFIGAVAGGCVRRAAG